MARWRVCRATAVPLLVVAVLAVAVSPARGDGDPASDYLLTNQVFLTSQSATVSPAQQELLTAVRGANRAGFAVRVAIISSAYDLGAITPLWRKPSLYARFLGVELSLAYRQRLLVVMPNGFGFNWPGHSSADADRLLAAVPMGTGSDGLAGSAQTAVRRLAGAGGVNIAPVRPSVTTANQRSSSTEVPAIIGAAVGVLAALAVSGALLWRRRRRGPVAPRERRRILSWRPMPLWLRVAIAGVVLLAATGAGVSIRALRASNTSASIASVVTPPPFIWAAGQRPAPDFALRDQDGRPVSIAAYRGRPVIVTFIDPLCRDLCPLEAQVLNQAERQLPASQRPAILAVSVDVYANTRADLLEDVSKWSLVPQWRWAVGQPAQLAAVWKQYKVGVSVVTKRIAGTTLHYVTHTEAAYVIDSTGHERGLFFWPFYPQDVEHFLKRLA
jgi:cytochrome oxidase Cu insertion factor (SCO1/SenC/PrrC family)